MKASILVALVVLAAIASGGCGRKAKPEPLWGAARIITITDRSR